MFNILKNKNGITLIALVITIIVLLILAGISISMLSGNNGILQKSAKAKEQTGISQEKEYISLAYNSVVIDKTSKGDTSAVTGTELDPAIKTYNSTVSAEDVDNQIIITFENGHKYSIDDTGIITEIKPIPITKIELTDTKLSIEPGRSKTLTATIEPANTTENIKWISENENIATVNEKTGEVTVLATANLGSTVVIKASNQLGTIISNNVCNVTVELAKARTGIVNNYREGEENDWEILYEGAVETGGDIRIYLIKKTATSAEGLSDSISTYNGVGDFEDTTKFPAVAQGLLYKIKSRTGLIKYYGTINGNETGKLLDNFKSMEYLLDSSLEKWSQYKDKVSSTHPIQFADYVIGAPTMELLVASYNSMKPATWNLADLESSDTGYVASIGQGLTNSQDTPWNHGRTYWLACPYADKKWKDGYRMYYVHASWKCLQEGANGLSYSLRPVVCLKSGATLVEDSENEGQFKIQFRAGQN